VRLKIVVHDGPLRHWRSGTKSAMPTSATPTSTMPTLAEVFALVQHGWRRTKQVFCAMRGHHYVLRMHRRRLSLHCPVCGYTTVGWDLSDPTPRPQPSDRPRFLELLRKRG
jgi:hypothetical protein